jgi:hypothetical protein
MPQADVQVLVQGQGQGQGYIYMVFCLTSSILRYFDELSVAVDFVHIRRSGRKA